MVDFLNHISNTFHYCFLYFKFLFRSYLKGLFIASAINIRGFWLYRLYRCNG